MQTSYAFISAYKQRITALDRAIQNQQRQQQQAQPGHQQEKRRDGHGVVEHRKLIQRFRQFLADEEKFWTQLVLRLWRSFGLTEAQPALLALGLLSLTGDGVTEAMDGPAQQNGRNHYQFPAEDAKPTPPTSGADRDSRLAILSKALICFGDIARYRELYNEANGRPRAGHEDMGTGRRGRRRGATAGAEALPRPRNYDKAQQCYEQARLLVPYEGNPSHQLAILASYQKDSFASLVHYYRALCVRQPYDTAAENLGTVLTKALDLWRARTRRERERSGTTDPHLPPRVRIEILKERVVVLHALWRVGMDKGIEKMDSIARRHDRTVYDDFLSLTAGRHIPVEMISNTVVLSQGALWKHRMRRDLPTAHNSRRHEVPPPAPGTSLIIEWRILDHLFDLHRALLEVGCEELKDPLPVDTADDIAQRITATFRRTLPALRIASKWLSANFKYVMQDQEFAAFQEKEKTRGVELTKKTLEKISGYSVHTIRFWKGYADFMRLLARAFPARNLPALTAPLEEDIEMRGFLPLRNLMGELKTAAEGGKSVTSGYAREQVHPNVEQLMRISDLLDDAKVLAEMENSPLQLLGGYIVFDENIIEDERPPTHPEVTAQIAPTNSAVELHQEHLLASIRDHSWVNNAMRDFEEDNMTEATSKTEDDVLKAAFDHLNSPQPEDEDRKEYEDEEDEIVYMQRSPSLGQRSPPSHNSPKTPKKSIMSPNGLSPRSPTYPQATSPFNAPTQQPQMVAPTTAQDLLNNVMNMGVKRTVSGNTPTHTESSAPQPPLLFGSELSHRPSHSIWSASRDEQSLKFTGGAAPAARAYPNQHRSFQGGASQDMSQQSIWSYTNGSQNSQPNVIGSLPSVPFAPAQYSNMIGGHQRVPSSSIPAAQLFSNMNHIQQQDPFVYSSPIAQQPIHRPEMHQSMSPPYMSPAMTPGNGGFYGGNPLSPYHSRHQSFHDPRMVQSFTSPPMSQQVWGNTG
ncbi:hypothetical protein BDQ12DRAFT_617701 [Crucibulum laeve]|uniref:Est1 DNA/RNA binding domain-containing protein n=1 Tax=Crucibulum laeve TaxID=68775 RepID=A0A5C3LTL5_9AGAR|nr:hypothetical protein BDQ12DRAFT_617701 [Crucibulum laeve]